MTQLASPYDDPIMFVMKSFVKFLVKSECVLGQSKRYNIYTIIICIIIMSVESSVLTLANSLPAVNLNQHASPTGDQVVNGMLNCSS